MGVEWDLGCDRCRRFIWLGSQKPEKWGGFQVSDATVERFLGLHAATRGCTLRLTNDGTPAPPWEALAASGWHEDILSRTFWDSWRDDALVCAQCGAPAVEGAGLRKNEYLWLCGDACYAAYVREYAERERLIYDSTSDAVAAPTEGTLVVGCVDCHELFTLDHGLDDDGGARDMVRFAYFLGDHVCRADPHGLVAARTPAWRDPLTLFVAHGDATVPWRRYRF